MSEGHQKALIGKTSEGLLYLTPAGKKQMKPWVTDIDSNVYAFRPEADAQAVSAAMARLSRNSSDLRTIIADEFLGNEGKELALLRRVVNQFGDDSVMQLYPMQMVFEGVSNLATKEIEWGRLAAYLEQSTRYLRFDRKDESGHYAYFTPEEFDAKTAALYEKYLNEIFDIYSELYNKLLKYIMATSDLKEEERDGAWRRACHAQACDGVRSLLPAATKATVGVVGSAQAINNMILHMSSHELPEMNTLAQKALEAARKVAPVFFERTDMPTRGGLISAHRKDTRDASRELASRLLRDAKPSSVNGPWVRMLSSDGSEDELIAKILADASNYSFENVADAVKKLSDDEKRSVIKTYVGERYNRRAKPGRAFEFPHYLFEVQCDYGAFRDIQRHRLVDGLDWQMLTTKLGHEIPKIIHDAKLAKKYEQAVELSQELYAELHKPGFEQQAQYATLFGHIMRFTVKINARSLVHTAELRTSSQGHPAYRKVYQDMHALVEAIHPTIASGMMFVSQDEDEALARLGAERHHQTRFGDDA